LRGGVLVTGLMTICCKLTYTTLRIIVPKITSPIDIILRISADSLKNTNPITVSKIVDKPVQIA
jgi:hypothetical protein